MNNWNNFLKHQPKIEAFFDSRTNTFSYVVFDSDSRNAAIIDSVLDYEPNGATIFYETANKIIDYIQDNQLSVQWILETHAHADHLSAAQYLKAKLGGKIGIGEKITDVQKLFAEVFDENEAFDRDGKVFDKLFTDGESFYLGTIPVRVIYTPGHTPADYSYVFGDAVFPGDTIFMPDFGSARCDFPKGSAQMLYESVQKLFELPDQMRMFVCHDYLPKGRTEYRYETSIGEQKANNIHFKNGNAREMFVTMREERDKLLEMPKLIIPSIQINIRAGHLPLNENGKTFLKIPVNSAFSKLI